MILALKKLIFSLCLTRDLAQRLQNHLGEQLRCAETGTEEMIHQYHRRRYDRHIFAWRRRVERVLYSGALVGNNLKDNKVSGLRRALSLPPKSNAWDLPDVKGPRRSQSAPPECIEDGIIATLRRRAEYSTNNPIIFSKVQ